MRRFYCESRNIINGTVYFDKGEATHISRVLRLEKGERIIVSAGDGMDNYCTVLAVGEECTAKVDKTVKNENEPAIEVILFQSVIKNEKMDFLVQKVTELGITKIVPVICERTVVKLEDKRKEEKKQERWQRIALEACKQCGRSRIPVVTGAKSFREALSMLDECTLKLVAYENERTENISTAVARADRIGYFIGPEGGITENEHQLLVSTGAKSVSLGRRILRAETAAIAAGTAILLLTGEMDV